MIVFFDNWKCSEVISLDESSMFVNSNKTNREIVLEMIEASQYKILISILVKQKDP